MSSIGGVRAGVGSGPYTMTKHAVQAFGTALRAELKMFGVDVCLINPGPYATGFNDRMANDPGPWFDRKRAAPEDVAVMDQLMQRITVGQMEPSEVVKRYVELVEAESTELVNFVPPDIVERMSKSMPARMRIEWDVPIRWTTGWCCAPTCSARRRTASIPAILSYGPYGKGLAFQEGYKTAWEIMVAREPRRRSPARRNQYQNWEVVDPEKWVPDGYACVRVDSRGAGRSPGYPRHLRRRARRRDFYHCIEWAGGAAVVAAARSA